MQITTQPTPNFQANLYISERAITTAQKSFDKLAGKPNFSLSNISKFCKQASSVKKELGTDGLKLFASTIFNLKRNAQSSFEVLKKVFEAKTKYMPGRITILKQDDGLIYSVNSESFYCIMEEDPDGLVTTIHKEWMGGDSNVIEAPKKVLPYDLESIEPVCRNLFENLVKLTKDRFGNSIYERFLD